MTVFIASFLFVVLAEMGDKTQLLAMAFAARFPAKTVLAGVLVATLLNHLLAVVLGNWLTSVVPFDGIQIAAAASFILFGLWTLRGDRLEGEDKKYAFSPFWTVAVAFFFAEMGDKTQLATVALAAKYHSILPIWMGTTAGMMVADAFGIIVGVVHGEEDPRAVREVVCRRDFHFLWGRRPLRYTAEEPADAAIDGGRTPPDRLAHRPGRPLGPQSEVPPEQGRVNVARSKKTP